MRQRWGRTAGAISPTVNVADADAFWAKLCTPLGRRCASRTLLPKDNVYDRTPRRAHHNYEPRYIRYARTRRPFRLTTASQAIDAEMQRVEKKRKHKQHNTYTSHAAAQATLPNPSTCPFPS